MPHAIIIPPGVHNHQPNGVLVTVTTYNQSLPPPPPPSPSPSTIQVGPIQLLVQSTPTNVYREEFVQDNRPAKTLVADSGSDEALPHDPTSLSLLETGNKSTPISKLLPELFVLIFKFALGPIPDGTRDRNAPLSEVGASDTEPDFWQRFMAIGGTNQFWRGVLHKHIRVVPFPDAVNARFLGTLIKSMTSRGDGQGAVSKRTDDIVMADIIGSRPRCRPVRFSGYKLLLDHVMETNFEHVRVLNMERELEWREASQYLKYPALKLCGLALRGTPSDGLPLEITMELFQNQASLLRELTLRRYYLPANSLILPNLTRLSLSNLQEAPQAAVYAMLRAARNLTSLHLVFGLPLVQIAERERPLEFPFLQDLRIVDQDGLEPAIRFIHCLRAPLDVNMGLSWLWIDITEAKAAVLRVGLQAIFEGWRQATRTNDELTWPANTAMIV